MNSQIHNLLTKGVIATCLLILSLLFLPLSVSAKEELLTKGAACIMANGEYNLYAGDIPGYNALEAAWSKGKIAKVTGFLKNDNFLYYGVTVYGERDAFSDLYLYKYSCLRKTSTQLAYLFRHKGGNRDSIVGYFGFIENSKRYYQVWGGILGGGGGDWGVYDKNDGKYYDVFFWKDFGIRNRECGDDAGPSGCFRKIEETNGILNIQMSKNGITEEVNKYRLNFKNKKLITY